MLGVLVINSTCKDKRNFGNHDIIMGIKSSAKEHTTLAQFILYDFPKKQFPPADYISDKIRT